MKRGKYESTAPRSARSTSVKTLAVMLSLVLVLGTVIGGTLAWLIATSEPVTNTFTVGDINISLKETTSVYKIIPGGKSAKDPTITVAEGSEKCYVYALVENDVALNDTIVATPNIDTGKWQQVETKGNKTLYRYTSVVDASAGAQALAVFTEVKYADTILKDNIDDLKNKTIVITGFAHQSENTTQQAADDAANAWAWPATN